METVAQLQHVGGNWQLHKGENLLLCPAVEAENHSKGDISEGWNSSYDGSATSIGSEEVKITYVKIVLGIFPSLLSYSISAHWLHFKLLYKKKKREAKRNPFLDSRSLYTHPPVQTCLSFVFSTCIAFRCL